MSENDFVQIKIINHLFQVHGKNTESGTVRGIANNSADDGDDEITGFTVTGDAQDKIDLSAFVGEDGMALFSAVTDVADSIPDDADYTIDLTGAGGGTITVLGVTTLGDGDFIFS